MTRTLFFGTDVSGAKNVVCAMTQEGTEAEIGDVRRFPNEAALAKFVGLTWTRHQSGKL